MRLDINVLDTHTVGAEEGRQHVEAHVAKLAGLGAVEQRRCEENGEFWVVMLDPEGNEFCVQ